MKTKINNQNGLTLVELLAVIAIGGIIMVFATSLIVQAMKNQERINIESTLRDEADIIMAQLTKAIFTLKESEYEGNVECGVIRGGITEKLSCITEAANLNTNAAAAVANAKQTMGACTPETNCMPFALIQVKDPDSGDISYIGFEGKKIRIKDEEYTIQNDNVTLLPYYTIERLVEVDETGVIKSNRNRVSMKISFTLRHEIKDATRTFQNEVMTVNNK